MIIPNEAFLSAIIAALLWVVKKLDTLTTTVAQVVQYINDEAGAEVINKNLKPKKSV